MVGALPRLREGQAIAVLSSREAACGLLLLLLDHATSCVHALGQFFKRDLLGRRQNLRAGGRLGELALAALLRHLQPEAGKFRRELFHCSTSLRNAVDRPAAPFNLRKAIDMPCDSAASKSRR